MLVKSNISKITLKVSSRFSVFQVKYLKSSIRFSVVPSQAGNNLYVYVVLHSMAVIGVAEGGGVPL